MQDRFKFRYFNKDSKRMYYGQGFHIQKLQNDPINIIFWDNEEHSHLQWKPDVVVMQCTGLKDKNGKLIYEGDIVKITKESWDREKYSLVYLICWDTTQWQLGLLKYQRLKAQSNRRCDRQFPFKNIVSFEDYTPKKNFAQCEVIGNIYENSELLEDK